MGAQSSHIQDSCAFCVLFACFLCAFCGLQVSHPNTAAALPYPSAAAAITPQPCPGSAALGLPSKLFTLFPIN